MDLLLNPFYILGAMARDSKQTLVRLTDEASLRRDASECANARSILTNPRKRLTAEVAWLPGVSPKRIEEVLSTLTNPMVSAWEYNKVPSIGRVNLMASILNHFSQFETEEVSRRLLELAVTFDEIQSDQVLELINEDRIAGGFPIVRDLNVLESLISDRRIYFKNVMSRAFDSLGTADKVKALTLIVDFATKRGSQNAPVLIDDLVDMYELKMQVILEEKEKRIKSLVKRVRAEADAKVRDSKLKLGVAQLMQAIKDWSTFTRPILVSAKSRGLGHDLSKQIATLVRNLGIDLFNEYGKLDLSIQFTNMLRIEFAEVAEIAEATAEDINTLRSLHWLQQRAQRRDHPEIRPGVVAIGVVIGVILIGILFSKSSEFKNQHYNNRTYGSQHTSYSDQSPKARSPNTSIGARGENSSKELSYKKPPVGAYNILSVPQIRWCLRERIRIESIRNLPRTKTEVEAFNRKVDDYNIRCGSFQYSRDALEQARREVKANRERIAQQAIQKFKGTEKRARSTGRRHAPNNSSKRIKPQQTSQISTPGAPLVRKVQGLLNALGYDAGPADGQYGEKTAEAVRAFQKDAGVVQKDIINNELLILLQNAKNKDIASTWNSKSSAKESRDDRINQLLAVIQGSKDKNISSLSTAKAGNSTEGVYFTRGSYRNDVLSLQGTPDSIDTYEPLGYEVWNYGLSSVVISLSTKRVLSWTGGQNLKVK